MIDILLGAGLVVALWGIGLYVYADSLRPTGPTYKDENGIRWEAAPREQRRR